jgi:CRISPR-associated protein Csb2
VALSFVITARFLDPRFHGRADGGEPEWPPSPLRLLQALLAAAALRSRGSPIPDDVRAALVWLERQPAPGLIAPATFPHGTGYRLSVPNNALDIVAKAWARGNDSMSGDANPATHRAMKTVKPTVFREGDAVHFVFALAATPLPEEFGHVETLSGVAGHLVALGWGVDLVVGSAAVLADAALDALPGERWLPAARGGPMLRQPLEGTLDALEERHRGFLDRIHNRVWTSPPPLTRFTVVAYARPGDALSRSTAAFLLKAADGSNRFRAFDTTREAIVVAGRVRHAAHQAARASKGDVWSEAQIASFVLGHTRSERGEAVDGEVHVPVGARRFAYLPLPTLHQINDGERVGAVRRVLVMSFANDCDGEIAWAETALSGAELVDEATQRPVAILEPAEQSDTITRRYCPRDGASTWATVTPVVLPGFDDPGHLRRRLKKGVSAEEQPRLLARLDARVDGLVRRAIEQAGFPAALAKAADIDFRETGFFAGTDLAGRYRVPRHLERLPRIHVRIQWRDAEGAPHRMPGPICIGGGRFYGLGLFATS